MAKEERKEMIRKLSFKNTFLLLIIALSWLGLSTVGETWASFLDTETSLGNTFTAATLDFSLSSSGNFSPNVTPTQLSSRTISVVKDGTLGFGYNLQTENETGDLCDYINLTVTRDGVDIGYSGTLKDFSYGAGEFSAPEDWQFTVTLTSSDSDLQNKTCQFNFVFRGWQTGSDGSWGFIDEEILGNTLGSSDWMPTPAPTPNVVINEVYYHGDNKGEWVELYNKTNIPIDVGGWIIRDNSTFDTLPSATISANGFGVIITQESTVTGINSSATIITLDNVTIGNGLADNGDSVILERNDGLEIDAMSYGTDTYAFSPACPDVVEGHSLSRYPVGQDTNTKNDWQKLDSPNPGE